MATALERDEDLALPLVALGGGLALFGMIAFTRTVNQEILNRL